MSRREVIKRVLLSMLIGIALGAVISELSFALLDNGTTRPPKQVDIQIPAGTAARVARGETDPSLPPSMTFVVGDQLVVTNQDSVTHTLGPLVIPAGGSANMNLAAPNGYNLLCSFEPTKYLSLSLLPPLTLSTRIVGILEAGINIGFLISVYAVFAMRGSQKKVAA